MKQLLDLHGAMALLEALLILLFVMAIHPLRDIIVAKLRLAVSNWGLATYHLLLDVIICLTVCGKVFPSMRCSP
jgi:hypothetical protein